MTAYFNVKIKPACKFWAAAGNGFAFCELSCEWFPFFVRVCLLLTSVPHSCYPLPTLVQFCFRYDFVFVCDSVCVCVCLCEAVRSPPLLLESQKKHKVKQWRRKPPGL